MDSPAGRGRKEPAAPSGIRNPVPSPEPRQDPRMGGPSHPILQEKGELYCMAMEAAISCPQIWGRQGSWSLQSTKVGRTPLRNSHTATTAGAVLSQTSWCWGAGLQGGLAGKGAEIRRHVTSGMKPKVPRIPSSSQHTIPAQRAAAGPTEGSEQLRTPWRGSSFLLQRKVPPPSQTASHGAFLLSPSLSRDQTTEKQRESAMAILKPRLPAESSPRPGSWWRLSHLQGTTVTHLTFSDTYQALCTDYHIYSSQEVDFFFLIYLFWLCWVFVAACGLSLVAASGCYSSLRCTGFSLRWLLVV